MGALSHDSGDESDARDGVGESGIVAGMRTRGRGLGWIFGVGVLALSACNGGDPAGDDGSSSGSNSSVGEGSTGGLPTTSGTDPGSTVDSTETSPPESTESTSGSTGTTAGESTGPGTSGDTDSSGLACPIADEPGVMQLALAPTLFGEAADPSGEAVCAILNPERGFHQFVDLRGLDDDTLDDAAADGISVLYGQVLIPEYRDAPLDDVVLTEVAAGFDRVLMHGMKVVPRFHYSNGGDEPDAALDRILGHIDQLAPLLQSHASVILTLQAGFIGAWGEWHSSQNGLDAPGPRKQILDALLAALPADRTVTVRRPSFKKEAYGGPVTAATAHDGSALARVGHVNDCFLASDSDFGTYQEAGEKDYAIADSRFVPVGGETCAVNPPRSECAAAKDELALLHWTHLNAGYHPDVLGGWKAEGCYAEIACRLGYRLAATEVRWVATATAGGTVPVSLMLINDGYAAPVNARPLVLVLDGPTRFETISDFDVRTLQPGEAQTVCVDAYVTPEAPVGSYRIGVRLADPSPMLEIDPRQAIRLANDTGVEWAGGVNWLAAMVDVQ